MKLLFDENLSWRLVPVLASAYPESRHVDQVGLHGQSDQHIWCHAARNNLVIVSKDDDFRQLSFLHGAPPKVIRLVVGNAGIPVIADLLLREQATVERFVADAQASLLILA